MNKVLIKLSILFTLGTYGYAEETKEVSREAVKEVNWWEQAGDPDSDYWWINEYVDEQSE